MDAFKMFMIDSERASGFPSPEMERVDHIILAINERHGRYQNGCSIHVPMAMSSLPAEAAGVNTSGVTHTGRRAVR